SARPARSTSSTQTRAWPDAARRRRRMATSFYDLSVATYLQTLNGVVHFLQRGLDHCQDHNIDLGELVETRLYGDMLPFRFQLVSVAHHSKGSIEGIKAGIFNPPGQVPELSYADLQQLVAG